MRCAAILGLGAVALAPAGCNAIFGLDPTTERDAAVAGDAPADAPFPHIFLTWQVATQNPDGTPGALAYPPISPAPTVQAVRSNGPAQAITYGASGDIALPFDVPDDKWRVVYTLDDGVARELQRTADQLTRITIPEFGRLDRIAAPAGSGYQLTPAGLIGSYHYTLPRLFTTGLWTQPTNPLVVPPGSTIADPFSNATSSSGPLGAPEASRGDRQLLVDYANPNDGVCTLVSKGAGLASLDLVAGMLTPGAPPWRTTTRQQGLDADTIAPSDRMQTALGGMFDGTTKLVRAQIGDLATTAMPSFTQHVFGNALPAPLMIVLADCIGHPFLSSPFVDPPELVAALALTPAAYLEITDRRSIGAGYPDVSSGMAVVSTMPDAAITYPAPLVTSVMLGTHALSGLTATDHAAYTLPAVSDDLSFTPDQGAADYYVVTLHKLVGATLQPTRIYTVTRTTVRIDANVLASGEYIFQIDAIVGVPNAAAGDFTVIAYPMGLATVFTRSFVVP